jgi:hypothetical protein
LERQVEKICKLALPLSFQIRYHPTEYGDIEMVISDKYFANVLLRDARYIKMGEVDDDGFVRIQVSEFHRVKTPQHLENMPQAQAHVNGFALISTNVSRSFGYGGQRSIFQYYRRDSDLSYYAIIKKEGRPDRKVLLGSIQESSSRIFQVAYVINKKFARDQKFDKMELGKYLPSAFGPRIMKATLDILAKEGHLIAETAKSSKINQTKEVFAKTEKLEKYMGDPRSWKKPNGFNIGSLATTSDQ